MVPLEIKNSASVKIFKTKKLLTIIYVRPTQITLANKDFSSVIILCCLDSIFDTDSKPAIRFFVERIVFMMEAYT